MEFILHGTGASGGVPNISCLIQNAHTPCPTCLSTSKVDGKRNIRRNTGALFKLQSSDDIVVIDAGKTFIQSAIEIFPRYKLKRIAAVILTHAHADAINGLDDLRGWTLQGVIQEHIDVYLSKSTFDEVQRCFPYLVSKEFATGGGAVPDFRYNLFEDGIPFIISDTYTITPIAVHHGRYFGTVPSPHSLPPSPGPKSPSSSTTLSNGQLETLSLNSEPIIVPYVAYGFVITAPSYIPGSIVYISDVSDIPKSTWDTLRSLSSSSPCLPDTHISYDPPQRLLQPSLLILDCLRPLPHTSHFGLEQALSTALKLSTQYSSSFFHSPAASPPRFQTYLTGFSHEMTHKEWQLVCETLSSPGPTTHLLEQVEWASDLRRDIVEDTIKIGSAAFEKEDVGDKRVWVRPAYDGMRIVIGKDGEVVNDDGEILKF